TDDRSRTPGARPASWPFPRLQVHPPQLPAVGVLDVRALEVQIAVAAGTPRDVGDEAARGLRRLDNVVARDGALPSRSVVRTDAEIVDRLVLVAHPRREVKRVVGLHVNHPAIKYSRAVIRGIEDHRGGGGGAVAAPQGVAATA